MGNTLYWVDTSTVYMSRIMKLSVYLSLTMMNLKIATFELNCSFLVLLTAFTASFLSNDSICTVDTCIQLTWFCL